MPFGVGTAHVPVGVGTQVADLVRECVEVRAGGWAGGELRVLTVRSVRTGPLLPASPRLSPPHVVHKLWAT
ncbi:hypothetical protein ACQYWQ_13780 [Streptomyces sp. P6-2-1]|uniref:hypothetical protein n=1 Tax=unclassified Streptomyces TaxID=2593676 RepID=UPI003D35EC08